MQATYPKLLHGDGGNESHMVVTGDGVENAFLYVGAKTIGTGTETVTIDSDQNALVMGPVTFNCSLAINGSLKVI